jgi:hypothetical protein
MSLKNKVLATVTTLTVVGGVGTAGVLGTAAAARAATPSCGTTCVDIFSQEFGQHGDPVYLLDVLGQGQKIGTPVILFRASGNDPAEDFRPEFLGTVLDFYDAGLVTAAFAQHYGCVPTTGNGGNGGNGDFGGCFGQSRSSFNDPAFEIEYTPGGVYSGLCVGVAATAVQREGVTLQDCGASSRTVWAIDLYNQPFESFVQGYAPLINGSDDNFSQPFVLTYPTSGYPTGQPGPQLQTDILSGSSAGSPPVPNYPSISGSQLWGADFGDHEA